MATLDNKQIRAGQVITISGTTGTDKSFFGDVLTVVAVHHPFMVFTYEDGGSVHKNKLDMREYTFMELSPEYISAMADES